VEETIANRPASEARRSASNARLVTRTADSVAYSLAIDASRAQASPRSIIDQTR